MFGLNCFFVKNNEKQTKKANKKNNVLKLKDAFNFLSTDMSTKSSRGRQHSFVEIDHEIFSTVILSLPLIQEGQLSVSGERMCTILVNRLED